MTTPTKKGPWELGGTFPIQSPEKGVTPSPTREIPWSVAERAYCVYAAKYGRNQTMERMAERGGFGPGEMDLFAPGWREEASELARYHTLKKLWAEKERLKDVVKEWMRGEGNKGQLRRNDDAPGWEAYEDAEKRLAEMLAIVLGGP